MFREPQPGKGENAPDYLLVANRDAFSPRTATLKIAGGNTQIQRMDKATAKWVAHPSESEGDTTIVRLELEDGSGELLKVVRRE